MSSIKTTVPFDKSKREFSRLFRIILQRNARHALKSPIFGSLEISAFTESIKGELPTDGDVILAACDSLYFRNFALQLIESMERLGKSEAFHLHLLEPTDEVIQQTQHLAESLKNVKLTYTIDPCILAAPLAHREIYYSAARFLLAPSLITAGVQRLLMVDVDAVMNKSPWTLLKAKSNNHSGGFIFRHNEKHPWRKVLASAVLFHATPGSSRLASALARSMAATFRLRPKYHIDQILPFFVSENARRLFWDFETFDIPAKIMGYEYEPDAAFWTAKGVKTIDTFVAERGKLLMAANQDASPTSASSEGTSQLYTGGDHTETAVGV